MAEAIDKETQVKAEGPGKSSTGKKAADKSRVFIVDDHTMFREGLRQLIEHDPGLTVCGDAADAATAIEGIGQSKPDVVIVDITLADSSGLDLVKSLRNDHEDLPVLVVSMHEESLYAERVLRAGGRGYIMKLETGTRVMEAIRQVLSGKIYLSEKMSARILENISGHQAIPSASPLELLSDREFEVFQLIGQGKGTREIANYLHLSVKTVEAHRANMKQKLKLRSGLELLRCAIRSFEAQSTR
jgi:DNA-binding NarL/FixJ family response regulator